MLFCSSLWSYQEDENEANGWTNIFARKNTSNRRYRRNFNVNLSSKNIGDQNLVNMSVRRSLLLIFQRTPKFIAGGHGSVGLISSCEKLHTCSWYCTKMCRISFRKGWLFLTKCCLKISWGPAIAKSMSSLLFK